ncbi:structural maintenance of chromosomes protein 6 [Physcia stellaris]|nr:structural maintenance of chromosomes protein 6 [Physcia stellaris]
MGLTLLGKLQEKIELFRLEQRYTRRRGRDGFSSEAQYVNGEYLYSYQRRDAPGKGRVKASTKEIAVPWERRQQPVAGDGTEGSL